MGFLRQCCEADLIEHAQSNTTISGEAINELLARYRGRALNTIMRWKMSDYDADDIVQEACLSAWQALPSFDCKLGKFGSWFYRILRNEFLDHCRRHAIEPARIPLDWEEGGGVPPGDARPFVELTGWEFWLALRGALDELPNKQREAVYLRIVEDEAYQAIASRMDIGYKAAYKNVNSGLSTLRELLMGNGKVAAALAAMAEGKGRTLLGEYR